MQWQQLCHPCCLVGQTQAVCVRPRAGRLPCNSCAGSDDVLEQNLALANEQCSAFFDLMKKNKEQALLSAPYEFQVGV